MSEYDLSWMEQNPKIGYHNGIARPVFLNREAFWICYSGTAHPEVVEMVEWEWDDSFKNYFIKEVNKQMTQNEVKSHLKILVQEANEENEKLKENESVRVFVTEDSNTPVKNLSQFGSKDSKEDVQKFIKPSTKEEFIENFKSTVESEKERVQENPIERNQHGALIIDEEKPLDKG